MPCHKLLKVSPQQVGKGRPGGHVGVVDSVDAPYNLKDYLGPGGLGVPGVGLLFLWLSHGSTKLECQKIDRG